MMKSCGTCSRSLLRVAKTYEIVNKVLASGGRQFQTDETKVMATGRRSDYRIGAADGADTQFREQRTLRGSDANTFRQLRDARTLNGDVSAA